MRENRSKKNRKTAKQGWGNRMAMLGIMMVIISLAVVMNFSASSLREKDLEYQVKEQNLEKELAKEQTRSEQLEEYRIYVQTKQYIENVAKEKLGLVKKDEILFKPKESK